MIIYNPLDGDAFTSSIPGNPRHCFLMTRLGNPIPKSVLNIENAVKSACKKFNYQVIDASSQVTGRDFLLKIWKIIASALLSIGICHKDIPQTTQANIYYELGVAQAMGKETLLIKSALAKIPSDFIRTEHIEFNTAFKAKFEKYMRSLSAQADHYELVADQLERNPILAIDYLKRAFLISGKKHLREKAKSFIDEAGLEDRAKNSVELLAVNF